MYLSDPKQSVISPVTGGIILYQIPQRFFFLHFVCKQSVASTDLKQCIIRILAHRIVLQYLRVFYYSFRVLLLIRGAQ